MKNQEFTYSLESGAISYISDKLEYDIEEIISDLKIFDDTKEKEDFIKQLINDRKITEIKRDSSSIIYQVLK
jgi:hypothetical protein